VSISTMYGRTLYEATISQPINIATDTWANGIYLLRNGTPSQLILKER
ncbi:MAG: hypothetical protein JNL32_12075, partial [Candidatus Kapabacteria bacterium]|nr:hypothetical protein [Candidatus Kapabacteria bacterium]